MTPTFSIGFDLTPEHTVIIIRLQAIAEQIDPCSYIVHSFRHAAAPAGSMQLLPDQYIRCSEQDGYKSWVHLESEKETALSMAIGKAIEEAIQE